MFVFCPCVRAACVYGGGGGDGGVCVCVCVCGNGAVLVGRSWTRISFEAGRGGLLCTTASYR